MHILSLLVHGFLQFSFLSTTCNAVDPRLLSRSVSHHGKGLLKRAPPVPTSFPPDLYGHTAVKVSRPKGWKAGYEDTTGEANNGTADPTGFDISDADPESQQIVMVVGGWPWDPENDKMRFGWGLDPDTMAVAGIELKTVDGGDDFPSQRVGHVAASFAGKMYIHGGFLLGRESALDDTWVLEIEGDATVGGTGGGNNTGVWSELKTGNNRPPGRWGHAIATDKTRIFIHGGFNNTHYLGDLWVLDIDRPENSTWIRVETTGTLPTPRKQHVTLITGGNLYLWGGTDDDIKAFDTLYILNLTSLVWEGSQGPKDGGRWGHTGTKLEKDLLFIAGTSGKQLTEDIWYLDTSTHRFNKYYVFGNPTPRRSHATVLLNNWLVNIAGVTAPSVPISTSSLVGANSSNNDTGGASTGSPPTSNSGIQILDLSSQSIVTAGIQNITVGEPFANNSMVPIRIRGFGFGDQTEGGINTVIVSGGGGPDGGANAWIGGNSTETNVSCYVTSSTRYEIRCVTAYVPSGYFVADVVVSSGGSVLNRVAVARGSGYSCALPTDQGGKPCEAELPDSPSDDGDGDVPPDHTSYPSLTGNAGLSAGIIAAITISTIIVAVVIGGLATWEATRRRRRASRSRDELLVERGGDEGVGVQQLSGSEKAMV